MANNQNTMRDMKRSILKAVRDSQRTKQDAMDEYVAARVNIKSLEGRLEEAREKPPCCAGRRRTRETPAPN